MHTSVCSAMKALSWGLYISPPNSTPYSQACDKGQINGKFKKDIETAFATWLGEVVDKLDPKKAIPVPEITQYLSWVANAFEAISHESIREACRAAYFPNGMKLAQLEDVGYFPADAPCKYQFSDDSTSNEGTDEESDSGNTSSEEEAGEAGGEVEAPEEEAQLSDASAGSSASESGVGSDTAGPVEIVWAKAARGIWGLAHTFGSSCS